MPTGYQIKDQSAAYFLTLRVVFWIDLFTRQSCRDIIIDSLKFCQSEKGLEIFAWVIMSNHIHILVRSSNDQLSNTIRDFKKFTSKKLIEHIIENPQESRKEWMLRLFKHAAGKQNKSGEYQLWTHSNHAIEVASNAFVESKVEYIHNNPVKAGIVSTPEDYLYSSAPFYAYGDGLIEVSTITFTVKTIK
jgi:REP element-mobilizing transposase RayT